MRALARVLISLLAVAPAIADDDRLQPPEQNGVELSRLVPADVGLYVEFGGNADLLRQLAAPATWRLLAEIAGQPADVGEPDAWRRQIRQSVGMDVEEAIDRLFARGVAFVGDGIARSSDAVVLCRPGPTDDVDSLIAKWSDGGVAGSPDVHRIFHNVGVTSRDGALVFGDLVPRRGMFRRIIDAAPSAKRLINDATFVRLRAALPRRLDGFMFARLGSPDKTEVAGHLPGPFGGAQTVLLGLQHDGNLLRLSAVGDALARPTTRGLRDRSLVERLPDDTLMAWQGGVDYSDLLDRVLALPETHPLRGALQLGATDTVVRELADALGLDSCLAVGLERVASQPLPIPAVALLIDAGTSGAASELLDQLVHNVKTVVDFLQMARGGSPLPPVREVTEANVVVHVLSLPSLGGADDAERTLDVALCWTVVDDVVVIGSGAGWVRRIVRARRGLDDRLGEALATSRVTIDRSRENVVVVQLARLSRIGQQWIDQLQATHPQILTEDWWRQQRLGQQDVRLGIDVSQEREQRVLRVTRVRADGICAGFLREGDRIVGAAHRRFSTERPIREMRAAISARTHARWLNLLVERDGVVQAVRLPIPFINPADALQRIVSLGRTIDRLVYFDQATSGELAKGFLTVQLVEPGTSRAPQPRIVPIGDGASTGE